MKCDPREAYERLVKPTDGPVARFLNRKISVRITCLIINHGAPPKPNNITLLVFATGLITALIIPCSPIIAAILVQLTSILDGVDGELARLTNRQTLFGGFLDSLLDRIVDASLLAASTLLLTGTLKPDTLLILASWLLSSCLLVSYMHSRGEAININFRSVKPGIPAGRDTRLLLLAVTLLIQPFNTMVYIGGLVFIAALSTTYIAVKTLVVAKQIDG